MLDYKKEFMSNAPTGQIFAATAEGLKPQYLGKKNGPTRVAVENVITRVQQGKLKPRRGLGRGGQGSREGRQLLISDAARRGGPVRAPPCPC